MEKKIPVTDFAELTQNLYSKIRDKALKTLGIPN